MLFKIRYSTRKLVLLLGLILLTGCVNSPPERPEDVCHIFKSKKIWWLEAEKSELSWGQSIPIMMAIMFQESSYKSSIRPPMKRFLGIPIPFTRPSSARGFAQALDGTWQRYQRTTGNYHAKRTNFKDAVDFVGWYNQQSAKNSSINSNDAYNLYLAYHEGQNGYNRKSYLKKPWLMDTAKKVSKRAERYAQQLSSCRDELKVGWFWRLLLRPFH